MEVRFIIKIIEKYFWIMCISCCFIFNPIIVQAANLSKDVSEIYTLENYAEDTVYSILRGSHLNYGNAKISKLSSNSISVYGLTQCHHVCDDVYLSLYLERKVNGSYATYKSWDYSKTDASNLSKSLVVSVPSGYYYRIRGYHAAKCDGSSKESISTLTDGVYVG